ncbi:MAG: hypothetical protein JJ916_04585 [Phycisphaerales bacterium]|nr:hypothetical protein [Phycisphaerales bacterium]
MSKAIPLAKFTLAFVIIAGGFSFIIGSLMGGGISRSYDAIKGINNDPRSILVQAVLIESDQTSAPIASLPMPGETMDDNAFRALMTQADGLRSSGGAHVRTPAMLVQHAESGHLSVKLGDRIFDAAISPSVIEIKDKYVLRVALEISHAEVDSSQTPSELVFTTAYTTAPGGVIVMDLGDLGAPGSRALLALRTSMINPRPTPSDD